ncbi:DoxX family protein [Nocardia sp. NPDC004278]
MPTVAAFLLAVLLTLTGFGHFIFVRYFRSLVPRWIPAPGSLVVATGLTELVTATLILLPDTRVLGGWAAAVLISGFLVVWLDALRTATRDSTGLTNHPLGALISLLVNLGYLSWAIYVALNASH